MHVIATAGHVDHGKSTLVRALTGRDPDRLEAEKRRGLTIELGYAWTTLPDVGDVAFVDVPGHRRFIGTMLAGLGPAPAVLFVVAADAGWSAQSAEHLRAIDALGLRHGLLVVTRCDLVAPERAEEVAQSGCERIAESSLGHVDSVVISAVTGAGLEDLRVALARLCSRLPQPRTDGRVRLWVDRSFTIDGSGTVVTGTLGAGTLHRGDRLAVGDRVVTIRGLQSLEAPQETVAATARVAVNLRGADASAIGRGDALLSAGDWRLTSVVDVRLREDAPDLPREARCHVGTASLRAYVRSLTPGAARLTLDRAVPLTPGDALILRDSGRDGAIWGAVVLDIEPPALRRRGDGARRGAALLDVGAAELAALVRTRGSLTDAEAAGLGHDLAGLSGVSRLDCHPEMLGGDEFVRIGSRVATRDVVSQWTSALEAAVDDQARHEPLRPGLPLAAARARAGLPDLATTELLCRAMALDISGGRVAREGTRPDLGAKSAALEGIVARLGDRPFDAPERPELEAAGLGVQELAAAEALGRVIRLADDLILLPTAPALAMRTLAALPQPFTTSAAREALASTRRVVIPLLEYLDRRGWTRRLDAGHREVVR